MKRSSSVFERLRYFHSQQHVREKKILAKKDKAPLSNSEKRSALLKFVMPFLSGDLSRNLATAYTTKDVPRFKNLWNELTEKMFAALDYSEKSHEKD